MSSYPEINEKTRRQLIGFATFVLVLAIVAPWIITDKSEQRISTRDSLYVINLNERDKDITNNYDDMLPNLNPSDNVNTINSASTQNHPTNVETTAESKTVSQKKVNETKQVSASNTQAKPNAKTSSKTQVVLKQKSKPASEPVKTTNSAKLSSTAKKYIIQLVALKNKQKIDELAALLILHNYDVVVTPKNPELNQVIKLKVGNYVQREQAEKAIIDLKKLTKLDGKILTN